MAGTDDSDAPTGRGPGRPKGSRNRTTRQIREMAQKFGPESIKDIRELARTTVDEKIRLEARKELLDRAYGKSVQSTELSTPDDNPITVIERIIIDPEGNEEGRVRASVNLREIDGKTRGLPSDNLHTGKAVDILPPTRQQLGYNPHRRWNN